MGSVKILSEKMQERIADFGWYELTDIQEKTIPKVINTKKDLIIESETASGKTEAVFLPILSLIEKSNYTSEVKVLYISPLKALINDQFSRIYKLIEEMNIRVTKWHGDVSVNLKKQFLTNPCGILQITPESLEAFMINRPERLKEVFHGVEYIVVDEIHSFIGTDRGYHLQSLLYRLDRCFDSKVRKFGLSATIDGIDTIKLWLNENIDNVELIRGERTDKKTFYSIVHFDDREGEKTDKIINDILHLTEGKKVIVFCNSRKKVEEYTYKLNDKIGYKKFYAHHSYIDKSLREDIENLIKSEEEVSIVSTSTLELGIDIGSVDMVVQIDCAATVSSLKQRVGRTGRKKGQDRITQIYTTYPESLLLSVASVELMKKGIVEAPKVVYKNYDYLFQQILSTIVERNGVRVEELIPLINQNPVFTAISNDKIVLLLKHMINNKFISSMDSTSELILGYNGEKLVHNKEFYAMFESTEPYEVIYESKKIGLFDEFKDVGQIILLSGRSWIVTSTIIENKKIFVEPFNQYLLPKFLPSLGERSDLVRKEVLAILKNKLIPKYVNIYGVDILKEYQNPYELVEKTENKILCVDRNTESCCQLFTSDKNLNTIRIYLLSIGCKEIYGDYSLGNLFYDKKRDINIIKGVSYIKEVDTMIQEIIEKENISKYFKYLPLELRKEIYLERKCSFETITEELKIFDFISVDNKIV